MKHKLKTLRLVLILILVVLLAGPVFWQPVLAQDAQPEPTQTSNPEVVLKQDIPGDTTVLLVAAAGLVLIALGAVVWYNRDRR